MALMTAPKIVSATKTFPRASYSSVGLTFSQLVISTFLSRGASETEAKARVRGSCEA